MAGSSGEGGCLLVNCLAAGFAAAETAMQQDRNALQAQICFIQTVVEELYACTQVSVMVKKDDYWSLHDPTINAGLEQVLRSTVVDELVWVKHTVHFGKEHVVKLIYASNVFTSAELNLAGFLG